MIVSHGRKGLPLLKTQHILNRTEVRGLGNTFKKLDLLIPKWVLMCFGGNCLFGTPCSIQVLIIRPKLLTSKQRKLVLMFKKKKRQQPPKCRPPMNRKLLAHQYPQRNHFYFNTDRQNAKQEISLLLLKRYLYDWLEFATLNWASQMHSGEDFLHKYKNTELVSHKTKKYLWISEDEASKLKNSVPTIWLGGGSMMTC